MIDRAALDELYAYTSFTWQAYANTVATLPADALLRPVPDSGWPALRDVLFHVAAGWDGWLREQLALDDALVEDRADVTSWAQIAAYRERTRGWLRRVIDETPDDLLQTRDAPMWTGTPAEMIVTRAEILAHILLHERGHHGDVTTLLSHLGAQPPAVDYLTYVFFRERAHQS